MGTVLLLDEPFANMDIRHCLDILEILQEQVHSGCSVVISIHDLNLAYRYWEHVFLVAPFFFVCTIGAVLFTRELNMMMSGEESAMALGVNTAQTKMWILIIAAAAAGASVAVSGVIGFVGLLVPHIVRILVGPDHRRLLPASILAGTIFLMGMDFLARWVSPMHEIQLGIFSAGIGGPFFLYLVMKNRFKTEIF